MCQRNSESGIWSSGRWKRQSAFSRTRKSLQPVVGLASPTMTSIILSLQLVWLSYKAAHKADAIAALPERPILTIIQPESILSFLS